MSNYRSGAAAARSRMLGKELITAARIETSAVCGLATGNEDF